MIVRPLSAAPNCRRSGGLAITLLFALALAAPAAAQVRGPATGRAAASLRIGPALTGAPLLGVNIVVNRKGGGGMAFVVTTTGTNGRFSTGIQLQPGPYEAFSPCQSSASCPRHESVSLTVAGQALPRGEKPALQTHRLGVHTVTAMAAGSQPPPPMVISGEVRRQAAAVPVRELPAHG